LSSMRAFCGFNNIGCFAEHRTVEPNNTPHCLSAWCLKLDMSYGGHRLPLSSVHAIRPHFIKPASTWCNNIFHIHARSNIQQSYHLEHSGAMASGGLIDVRRVWSIFGVISLLAFSVSHQSYRICQSLAASMTQWRICYCFFKGQPSR
jgi:hypothetical protein